MCAFVYIFIYTSYNVTHARIYMEKVNIIQAGKREEISHQKHGGESQRRWEWQNSEENIKKLTHNENDFGKKWRDKFFFNEFQIFP